MTECQENEVVRRKRRVSVSIVTTGGCTRAVETVDEQRQRQIGDLIFWIRHCRGTWSMRCNSAAQHAPTPSDNFPRLAIDWLGRERGALCQEAFQQENKLEDSIRCAVLTDSGLAGSL